jgi:hypothetical protein
MGRLQDAKYRVLESAAMHSPEIISVKPLDVSGLYFGDPLPRPIRPITVKVDTLNRPRRVWWAASYFVVDVEIIAVLRDIGELHFEEFPVTFVDRSGKTDKSTFRFLNLLDNIDCMDKGLSKYELDNDGFVAKIACLVIDAGRIPRERHLFRMKESESTILASDVFVEQVSGRLARGAKFVEIDEFELR